MNYEDIILSITEEVINELLPANSYNVGKAIKRREINLEKAKKGEALQLLKSDGSKEGSMAKPHLKFLTKDHTEGKAIRKSDSDGSKEGPTAKAHPVDNRPAQGGKIVKKLKSDGSKEGSMAKPHPIGIADDDDRPMAKPHPVGRAHLVDNHHAQGRQVDNRPAQGGKIVKKLKSDGSKEGSMAKPHPVRRAHLVGKAKKLIAKNT